MLLVLNAGALAAAVALRAGVRRRGPDEPSVPGHARGYLVIVHSTVLLTGLVGHLSVQVLTGVVAVVFLIATWLAEFPGRHGDPERPASRTAYNAAALFPPLAATAAFLVWPWPHLLEATRLWVWDDYTYHLVYPALWLREHAIAAPPAGSRIHHAGLVPALGQRGRQLVHGAVLPTVAPRRSPGSA